MAKVIQIHVVEAAGAKSFAGAKIMISGSSTEHVTNQDGLAQVLLDDGDVTIQINGASAYKGTVVNLKPKEVFTKGGERLAA
jgi:hypothetical protein